MHKLFDPIAEREYAACVADLLNSDEVLLFEAVDDDAAKRILEKLNNRYQAKLNETKDYLPDEYTKISACKVELSGRYVSMIVSEIGRAHV